jgi:hypothetical protein
MNDRVRQVTEQSVLVGVIRRLARMVRAVAAVLMTPLRPVLRRMESFDRAVERAVAARRVDEAAREQRVREVLAGSRLVQFIDRVFSIPAAAWPSSAVARRVTPIAREIQAMDRPQQIRLAGWMLAVGLAARIVSYFAMGETAGWVTAAVWAGVLLIATAMMVWNREIAAAWEDRRRRKQS